MDRCSEVSVLRVMATENVWDECPRCGCTMSPPDWPERLTPLVSCTCGYEGFQFVVQLATDDVSPEAAEAYRALCAWSELDEIA